MNIQQTSGNVDARRAITGWLVRTMRELDGYQAYAARVRYRLLPGIW